MKLKVGARRIARGKLDSFSRQRANKLEKEYEATSQIARQQLVESECSCKPIRLNRVNLVDLQPPGVKPRHAIEPTIRVRLLIAIGPWFAHVGILSSSRLRCNYCDLRSGHSLAVCHGKQNLSTVLATLTMSAFLVE